MLRTCFATLLALLSLAACGPDPTPPCEPICGDRCGSQISCEMTIDCPCPGGEMCSADTERCVALPTCADLGAECGTHPDGLGGMLDCGECAAPLACGARGDAMRCALPEAARSCTDAGTCWENPRPFGLADVIRVSAPSTEELWLATEPSSGYLNARLIRQDDSGWASFPLPLDTRVRELLALGGGSAIAVIDQPGLLYHDGTTLTVDALPDPTAVGRDFTGADDGDIWLLANAGAEQQLYKGQPGAWTLMESHDVGTTNLSGISSGGAILYGMGPLEIFEFDGTAWQVAAGAPQEGSYRDIHARADDDVVLASAVVMGTAPNFTEIRGKITAFNGTSAIEGVQWRDEATVLRIFGNGFETFGTNFGRAYELEAHTPIHVASAALVQDGSSPTLGVEVIAEEAQVFVRERPTPQDPINEGVARSLIEGPRFNIDALAVHDGVVWLDGGRFDGGLTLANADPATDLDATASGQIWRVTSDELWRVQAGEWAMVAGGSLLGELVAVKGDDAGGAWLAGRNGVGRFDGTEISVGDSFSDGVAIATAGDEVFVAGGDEVARFDGTNWTLTSVPNASSLYAVVGRAADDVWALGTTSDRNGFALVSHWDGTQWTSTELTESGAIVGVVDEGARLLAIMDSGVVLTFESTEWTVFDRLRVPLTDIARDEIGGAVWISGSRGVLLQR